MSSPGHLHYFAYGSNLLVEDGAAVEPGMALVEWDPFTSAILTAISALIPPPPEIPLYHAAAEILN